MNIAPINAMNCKPAQHNLKQQGPQRPQKSAQPSFNGLWGRTSSEFEFVNDNLSYIHKVHQYYPFFDETPKQINEALASKHYTEEIPFPVGHDYPEVEQYEINRAVQKDILPFAECEWKQYAKDKFAMLKTHRNYIEDVLRKFNLQNYIK